VQSLLHVPPVCAKLTVVEGAARWLDAKNHPKEVVGSVWPMVGGDVVELRVVTNLIKVGGIVRHTVVEDGAPSLNASNLHKGQVAFASLTVGECGARHPTANAMLLALGFVAHMEVGESVLRMAAHTLHKVRQSIAKNMVVGDAAAWMTVHDPP